MIRLNARAARLKGASSRPLIMDRTDRDDAHRASDSSSPLRATTEGARIRFPSVDPRCPPAYAGVRPTKVRVRNISLPPNHKNVFQTEHTDVFQMEHVLNHRGCFWVCPCRADGNLS